MKKIITSQIILLLALTQSGQSQGFMNLNFESANVSGYSVDDNIPISSALPGWSAYFVNSSETDTLTQVTYDGISTGGSVISVIDTNAPVLSPLQGEYSALLSGGGNNPLYSSIISQAGLVPSGAESLSFDAYVSGASFTVTLGGQTINMTALQTFSHYTLYGGNIPSSLAGVMETLSFTEPPATGVQPSFFELDNIQFSTSVIPEPSVLGLSALGGLFFTWRRWKK